MRTKITALVVALAIAAIVGPAAFANDGQRPTHPGKATGAHIHIGPMSTRIKLGG